MHKTPYKTNPYSNCIVEGGTQPPSFCFTGKHSPKEKLISNAPFQFHLNDCLACVSKLNNQMHNSECIMQNYGIFSENHLK